MRCPCHSQNLRTGKGKIVQNLSRTSCTIVTSAATPWIQKGSKNGKSVLPGFYNPKVKKMSEWIYGVDNQRFITLKFDRIDAGRLYHPDHQKTNLENQNVAPFGGCDVLFSYLYICVQYWLLRTSDFNRENHWRASLSLTCECVGWKQDWQIRTYLNILLLILLPT
jgi:hypothetical protein